MLGWFLKLLLILLVLRAIWRLLYGVFEGMQPRRSAPPAPEVRLVRDPVCGTFVVPGKALTAGAGDGTQYFCSERCRDQYRGA